MGSRCCGGAASPRGRGSYKAEAQTALRPVGAPPSARWNHCAVGPQSTKRIAPGLGA